MESLEIKKPASQSQNSRWLSGNYTPVSDELNVTNLAVDGKIPSNLNGMFLRNGPNPIFPPTPYHWFDGDGMIHALTLKNGKASYQNRFVITQGFKKEKVAKKSLYGGLLSGSPYKNAANTSIIHHNQKTLATWEGGSPYEIDHTNLKTKGLYTFDNQWAHPFTAHPKIDPTTNEMIIFGYNSNIIYYGVLDAKGKLNHSTQLTLPHSVMMHDFAITKNYSIFLDLPLTFTERGLQFRPDYGARIGVLPRKGLQSDIRWFAIDPCWVYHVLNAYEDGNTVILRGCRRPEWPKSTSVLYEWKLNLSTGKVTEKALDKIESEFPIVNPAFTGLEHQFGYVAKDRGAAGIGGLIKYDFHSKIQSEFNFGDQRIGGESFFVADPDEKKEDNGWLLNIIYDESKDKSEFVIIDAKQLSVVASVTLPHRVPYGLHCNWISS